MSFDEKSSKPGILSKNAPPVDQAVGVSDDQRNCKTVTVECRGLLNGYAQPSVSHVARGRLFTVWERPLDKFFCPELQRGRCGREDAGEAQWHDTSGMVPGLQPKCSPANRQSLIKLSLTLNKKSTRALKIYIYQREQKSDLDYNCCNILISCNCWTERVLRRLQFL